MMSHDKWDRELSFLYSH